MRLAVMAQTEAWLSSGLDDPLHKHEAALIVSHPPLTGSGFIGRRLNCRLAFKQSTRHQKRICCDQRSFPPWRAVEEFMAFSIGDEAIRADIKLLTIARPMSLRQARLSGADHEGHHPRPVGLDAARPR